MLCGGTELLNALPAKLRSASRTILLAEVSCQTWPVPASRQLVNDRFAAALAVSCLLIAITVTALSEAR